jgi:hypothetical protein
MATALEDLPAGQFPIEGRFELVVASCVLSQLDFGLVHACDAQFAARFPDDANLLRQSTHWKQRLHGVVRAMQARFVNQLAQLVAASGVIYLAESAQMCFIDVTPQGQWQTAGTWRMLETTSLADCFDERFTIVDRGRWEWVTRPADASKNQLRLFDVQALVLRLSDQHTATT